MEEKNFYELTPGQEVVYLQSKLSLHKNVVNIASALTLDNNVDFDLLKVALNKVIERNDCLRIKFFKKKGKLLQYFEDKRVLENIPVLKFETEKEQNAFIDKQVKKAVKFLKGQVIEPYFIHTFDKKQMIFMKVAHFVLDVYGINMIYKDLMDVYKALKNRIELPECPTSFEEMVKADLKKKHDKAYNEKNKEFFNEYFSNRENPYYAGIHGENNKIWQKQLKRKRHAMKLFLFQNKTVGYAHDINKELVDKVMAYCQETKQSPANFLFYTLSITASKMNGNVKNMLPMELCNCRGTVQTKKGAGTKAQSVLCYTTIDYEKTFKENFDKFCDDQNALYRHIGFSDLEVQSILHDTYHSGYLEIYYGIAFSFIPMMLPKGMSFMVYSNGHGALPCYIAQLYHLDGGNITMAYDAQEKIISKEDVATFHNNYLKVLETVTNNPEINLNDVRL